MDSLDGRVEVFIAVLSLLCSASIFFLTFSVIAAVVSGKCLEHCIEQRVVSLVFRATDTDG